MGREYDKSFLGNQGDNNLENLDRYLEEDLRKTRDGDSGAAFTMMLSNNAVDVEITDRSRAICADLICG